jgi:hypothetical protein
MTRSLRPSPLIYSAEFRATPLSLADFPQILARLRNLSHVLASEAGLL